MTSRIQLSALPGLANPLREHLERLDDNWFGCLAHTPLHSQPNVLTMLKKWGGHRLAAGTRPRSVDPLPALDRIIVYILDEADLGRQPAVCRRGIA